MWACCHVHHVHSMHASSGLPDNLKSHAVGHPWSSHMCVELVSIHMHNEQLLGFCSRRSIVCVRCLLTTVGLQASRFEFPFTSTQRPSPKVVGSCVVCQVGKMVHSFYNYWPSTFMLMLMPLTAIWRDLRLANLYSPLLERPDD
jgi:hypothetical protein